MSTTITIKERSTLLGSHKFEDVPPDVARFVSGYLAACWLSPDDLPHVLDHERQLGVGMLEGCPRCEADERQAEQVAGQAERAGGLP